MAFPPALPSLHVQAHSATSASFAGEDNADVLKYVNGERGPSGFCRATQPHAPLQPRPQRGAISFSASRIMIVELWRCEQSNNHERTLRKLALRCCSFFPLISVDFLKVGRRRRERYYYDDARETEECPR